MARAFDKFFPEQSDFILLYLDKATAMLEQEWHSRRDINTIKELQLIITIPRAKAYANKGLWQKAYQIMTKETLPLIEELTGKRNILDQQHATYQFLVDYYEKFNNPTRALKFLRLLRESEKEVYEKQNIQALNEMLIRYETEKKELQIQTLAREKQIQRQRFVGLTIGLLIILVLIIVSGRLKRKNVEQRLYETALTAELHQNELEKIRNNKQQTDKEQLDYYRVQNTIESIAQMISDSMIETDNKKTYLERLSKLDPKMLENIYQNTNVKITGMDMKYIICFVVDLDEKDICLIFNIEQASVYTVRYRIKKKLAKEDLFKMIL
jgi:hypothetical protein